jgi:dTDP-4-amino-4,6-dideoxygalactose transaminase
VTIDLIRASEFKNHDVRTLVPKMPTRENLIPYLTKIDEARWYSNFGPLSQELSERLAQHFGVSSENLCLIGNATLGIQSICELAIPNSCDLVEVPSFTFAASAMAVRSAGKQIRFIDVDGNMRCKPTKNARVVLDVLPFGDTARREAWMNTLELLIIDGAASFDALENFGKKFDLKNKWALAVSLHATKLIGAGEGGLIISNDLELIKRVKAWQNFGFDLATGDQRNSQFFGTNAKMSEYSCAVGLASLDQWSSTKSSLEKIQQKALDISFKHGFGVHGAMKNRYVNPYWIVTSQDSQTIANISQLCDENGIETRLWWQKGCHKMPAFKLTESENLLMTKMITSKYIGLPFHLFLNEDYWRTIDDILQRSKA